MAQPQVKPAPTKKVPVEPVYQVVEVIKPRHDNGNGRHRDTDTAREQSRDFRRAKNAVPDRDDERSGGREEDSPERTTADMASEEETAKVLEEQHELSLRMDLGDIAKATFEITDATGRVIDTFVDAEKPFTFEKIFQKAGTYAVTLVVADALGAVKEGGAR